MYLHGDIGNTLSIYMTCIEKVTLPKILLTQKRSSILQGVLGKDLTETNIKIFSNKKPTNA